MKIPNINELMQESTKYSLNKRDSSWLTELLKQDFNSAWVIIPEGRLQTTNQEMKKLKERYSIGAMCQLGNIYNNTNVNMALVLFTQDSMSEVFVSIYNGKTRINESTISSEKGTGTVATNFTLEYVSYIENLEKWFSGEDVTCANAELKKIATKDIEERFFYPGYYTDRAISVRKSLKQETTEPLSNISEILIPVASKEKTMGKCLTYGDLQYPLNYKSIAERPVTNIKLQKGDIIIPSINFQNNKPYLVREVKEDIYASGNMFVLRNSKLLPEYLCLYLSSDTARCVFETRSVGTVFFRLTYEMIKEFPVILPKQESSKYLDDFEILISQDRRVYNASSSQRVLTYYELLNNKGLLKRQKENKAEKIEDILDAELANTIKVHNEKQLRSFLTEDLRELNICYKNKAYKATLILAGSILEAVLIDWLSEIKGIDFFKITYKVKDDKGKEKSADLSDYINEIKYIERPHWMEEADKAHIIRKKRNLVHAKLCMKSDEINEEVCKKVIGYLKEVLKTRGAV